MGDYSKYFHGPAAWYPTGYFAEKMFFTDFTDGEGAWYITNGIATTGEDESKSDTKSDEETSRSAEETDYYTVAEEKSEKATDNREEEELLRRRSY